MPIVGSKAAVSAFGLGWSKQSADGAIIGALYSWGTNSAGATGLNTTSGNTTLPTQNGSDTDWVYITNGNYFGGAIKEDGTLWTWGWNSVRIGNNTTTGNTLVPTQIGTDTDWAKVSGYSDNPRFVTKTNGELWGWGYGINLGVNTTITYLVPVQVGVETDWEFVSCRSSAAIGVKTNGTIYSWGNDLYGATGQNTDANQVRATRTQIGSDTDWLQGDIDSHSVFVKTDGTMWGWGWNYGGQNGLNTTTGNTLVPTQIGSDTDWEYVTVGANHSLARKTNGTIYGFGINSNGVTGQNTTTGNTLVPTQIGSDTDWSITATSNNACFGIKTNGTLWAWGSNGEYLTGQNTNTGATLIPTQIGSDTDWKFTTGTRLRAISAIKEA